MPNGHDRAETHWTVVESQTILNESPFVRVDRQRITTPQGATVDNYYQVLLPDFAVAVPILEDGRVLTLWQYKHGARRYSLTFPAGNIEAGETPEQAMRRELLEETGYSAGEIVHLGTCVVNANQRCGQSHMMVFKDCVKVAEPDHNDLEAWDLRPMTVAEIDQAVASGAVVILSHFSVWHAARAKRLVGQDL